MVHSSLQTGLPTVNHLCWSCESYAETVRAKSCELLSNGAKCSVCISYRDSLRVQCNRWKKTKDNKSPPRTKTDSHANYRYLSSQQKDKRLSNFRSCLNAAETKVRHLQEGIDQSTEECGVSVDDELHGDLLSIMAQKDEIERSYKEGSFQRLFWEQQVHNSQAKSSKGFRWHPMMIRWCLHLKLISTAAYHAMRSSRFITLPSEHTLRDYSRWIESGMGVQSIVTQQLMDEVQFDKLEEWKKYVGVVFDEVKIKEGIVYDKHNCKVVGFVNIGSVNDCLAELERSFDKTQSELPAVAKYVLVFMVRGLFIRISFPYAQYATTGATSSELYPIVWTVVRHLEIAGFKVVSLTCDGASPNRKFFKMHACSEDSGLTYKVKNRYSSEDRYIYFVSDVPHLLKTTRNCWSNSFGHSQKRPLWINGQHISWEHLKRVYTRGDTSLSLVPTLKREHHIALNSFSRMRVDLASQVLSSSVANALEYYNEPDTVQTRRFVRIFDKFFDCLNTRHTKEGIYKRKPNLTPFRSLTDGRLKWLETDFLDYLKEWEQSIRGRTGFTKAQKKMMGLSSETKIGLKVTVKSIVEATRYLLKQRPASKGYICTSKFNQDPLEGFFGTHRMTGGWNDNPTVKQFLDNTVTLRVQKSAVLNPVRGNCRKRPHSLDEAIDNTALKRRKQIRRASN